VLAEIEKYPPRVRKYILGHGYSSKVIMRKEYDSGLLKHKYEMLQPESLILSSTTTKAQLPIVIGFASC
jgi:hypothetical protein